MSGKIEPQAEDFEAIGNPGGSLDGDRVAAEQYRQAQAHAMLRMFREANGRDAATLDELNRWLSEEG